MSETRRDVGQPTEDKSEFLGRHVRNERSRTLARLERLLPAWEAEDAYQDACLRALERLHQQKRTGALRSWFRTVLQRTVATRMLARATAAGDVEAEGSSLRERDVGNLCGCGHIALRRLGPHDRGILQHVLVEGRPLREHALHHEITPGNARVRLHRARKRPGASWSDQCGTCITEDAGARCDCCVR